MYDRITDFDAFGTNRDQLDFSTLLDFRTNCTGSTVQQAFDQGYVFLVQQGSTAVVRVDLNGGAHTDTNNVFDVVHLENVQANDVVALRESLFLV